MILATRPFPSKAAVLLAALWLVAAALGGAAPASGAEARLGRVVDGDTFETAEGKRVRLLGVDAPESGAPLSAEAASWLRARLSDRSLRLDVCSEPDAYGRALAVVSDGDGVVNLQLLEQGLAVPLLIPPCGLPVAEAAMAAAASAFRGRRGVFAPDRTPSSGPEGASALMGRRGAVVGKVLSVHRGPKATHINFGPDWRTDFTAVLLQKGRQRFEAFAVDPGRFVGWTVAVLGKVTEYNGPEIIVEGPDQVLPLDPPSEGGAP